MVRRTYGKPSIGLVLVCLAGSWIPMNSCRAEDYPACAAIQDPMAYNACLAKHSVPAPAVHGIPDPSGANGLTTSGGKPPLKSAWDFYHERNHGVAAMISHEHKRRSQQGKP